VQGSDRVQVTLEGSGGGSYFIPCESGGYYSLSLERSDQTASVSEGVMRVQVWQEGEKLVSEYQRSAGVATVTRLSRGPNGDEDLFLVEVP
jgi:hypothetical protein